MKLYKVANWAEIFETAETRKLEALKWVPTPNKHDGLGFGRMTVEPDSAALFGAWNLILQTASKGRGPSQRGILARNGEPLSAEDLFVMTGIPQKVFERALEFFSSRRIGWLTVEDVDAEEPPARPSVVPERPADAAGQTGSSPAEGKKEGNEGREGIGPSCPSSRQSQPPPEPSPIHPPRREAVQFIPVKPGLYRREYEAMLVDVDKEIRRIIESDKSYDLTLTPAAADLIRVLKEEGRFEARGAEVTKRPESWRRGALKPKAAAVLSSWRQRKAEIKAAMNGIVSTD